MLSESLIMFGFVFIVKEDIIEGLKNVLGSLFAI